MPGQWLWYRAWKSLAPCEVTLPCSISRDTIDWEEWLSSKQVGGGGSLPQSFLGSFSCNLHSNSAEMQRWVSTRPLQINSGEFRSSSSRCEELHNKVSNYCISAGSRTSPQLCLFSSHVLLLYLFPATEWLLLKCWFYAQVQRQQQTLALLQLLQWC